MKKNYLNRILSLSLVAGIAGALCALLLPASISFPASLVAGCCIGFYWDNIYESMLKIIKEFKEYKEVKENER